MNPRKLTLFTVLTASLLFTVHAQRPQPPDISKLPTVSAIEVLFHTNDDDKDHDTALNVDFSCKDSVFASTFVNSSQTSSQVVLLFWKNYTDDFTDGNSTPWVSIPVQSKVFKSAVHGCTTRVHIEPVGHDTWRFNYWVRLHYSDNTRDEYHYDDHALSEKVKENTFPLR